MRRGIEKEGLRVLAEVPLLEVTVDAESLAAALLEDVPLPPKAATDALHIAVAAVNGVEYLLTYPLNPLTESAAAADIRLSPEKLARLLETRNGR
mgnify:CR=1 FL=1